MANRAMLLISNSIEFNYENYNESEEVVAAANYSIPMFWFSLFSSEDVFYKKLEMEDGTFEDWPILVVERNIALDRVKKRKKSFLNLLPKGYDSLYSKWINLLQNINLMYIHLDMDEIRMMADNEDEYDLKLKEVLASVDNLTLYNSNILLEYFSGIEIEKSLFGIKINNPKSDEEIVSFLCGNSWIRKVTWEK